MTATSLFENPPFAKHGKKAAASFSPSLEMRYMQGKAAFWLMNAAKSGTEFNVSFFECLEWVSGSLKPLARAVPKFAKFYPAPILSAGDKKELLSSLSGAGSRTSSRLADIADEYPAFRPLLTDLSVWACQHIVNSAPRQPRMFSRAARQLRQTFGCTPEAIALCEFIFILRNTYQVEHYFEDALEVHKTMHVRLLSQILGMPSSKLVSAVAETGLCGIRNDDSRTFHLYQDVERLWHTENITSFSSLFCRPVKGGSLPLDAFRLEQADVAHTISLFATQGDAPVHLLLYGSPGTGKTTFAGSLASELGVKAWSVTSRLNDDEDDRRASLMACVHMASKHPGAFVLVDEAERLLDTDQSFGKNTKDKAWLNEFMETPGRRIIWITNQIEHIDQAVRRRFSFSLFFERLNGAERVVLWRQILAKHRVVSKISAEDVERLASRYPVSAAVVTNAIFQAKRLRLGKTVFANAVERVLEAHQTLSMDGCKRQKEKPAESYTLEGVSMDGDVRELLGKGRRLDELMREGAALPPGGGTMLFYGPPGTGKTALARHLARELHRECMVTRASDLLSPFVGVTEQQVAAAFARAEKSGAVLVIDEADSFLYSRDMAQRSWETTLVNEFLTNLEEYRGICICTSNRRDVMDAAAMRRFSFKISFTYAKPEQLRALYASLLSPLAKGALSLELERKLNACANLVPGDFHAVRSQYWLAEPSSHSHEDLVGALLNEQRMKLDVRTRRIGF